MASATRLTRWRRAARGHAILLLLRTTRLLPYDIACALGRAIGRLGYLLAGRARRRALAHLAVAFPDRPEAERRLVASDAFAHLAQCTVEIAREIRGDGALEALVDLPAASERVLAQALAQGKGVVVVTAHVGNWELLGRRIARRFEGLAVVARELNAPQLTAAMDEARRRAGMRTLWRGRPGMPRELIRVFQRGGLLALLIDQDTRVRSAFVPFFGRLASTPRAAGDLAVRFGAPVVACFVHRRPGNRHCIDARPIEVLRTGDREADALAITAASTLAIEAAIREAPSEWVWMHERWKTQPSAVSDESAPET